MSTFFDRLDLKIRLAKERAEREAAAKQPSPEPTNGLTNTTTVPEVEAQDDTCDIPIDNLPDDVPGDPGPWITWGCKHNMNPVPGKWVSKYCCMGTRTLWSTLQTD